ncbi:biotin--[acetyl-CoA-carboxylase] ligase [Candidatus Latescibacterota bacterium]
MTDPDKAETISQSIIKKIDTIKIDGDSFLWYDLSQVSSTIDAAVELAKNGCSSWTLVTADHQNEGRGTHGRDWIVPCGKGLLLSLVVPLPDKPRCLEDLSTLTAGILIECLNEYFDLPFKIKHPNDIILRGRKLAGIMYESVSCGENVLSLILGMGINLYQTREEFMNSGLPDAISLFCEAGFVPDRERLIFSFLKRFKKTYEKLC